LIVLPTDGRENDQKIRDKTVKAPNTLPYLRDDLNLRNQDSHSYTTAGKDTDFCDNLEIYISHSASIFMFLGSKIDEK